MKYLSLFSGIGGFELGIEQAYVATINRNKNRKSKNNTEENVKTRKRLVTKEGKNNDFKNGQDSQLFNGIADEREPDCVGYSEIDKYAIQIYSKHFIDHKNYGDIRKINPKELPDFDLLCGGFPCQSFSIAGKRGGFSDTRGTLFFEIARIAEQKRPRLLLLENVKGLLSHDNGRTFFTIIATLDELGYDCQWQVLNSKNFGVPQNRERVFIIGHLRGTSRPQVFPITNYDKKHFNKANKQGCASTLTGRNASGTNRRGNYIVGTLRTHKSGQGFREVKSLVSPTIPARARNGGSGQPVIKNNSMVRRLTPTECERLQGFPDNWTKQGIKQIDHFINGGKGIRQNYEIIEISDTQRYKTLGNAVTVNVIQAIIERLLYTEIK